MKKVSTLVAAACVMLLVGCSYIEDRPATAALTVQYATLKYIGDSPDKASRVHRVAASGRTAMLSGSHTLSDIDNAVRSAINWGELDPADRLLLDSLLVQLSEELQRRIGDGLLNDSDRVRVNQVIDWIQRAALLGGAKDG